jgi:hypothetical protein
MRNFNQKTLDSMRKYYATHRKIYDAMKDLCFARMGADGISAACLMLVDDGYEALFGDAETVSYLTGLSLTPDYGFLRCCVGGNTKPIIEALHKDGRSAAVFGYDEKGNLTSHFYPRSQYQDLKQVKAEKKNRVAIAV